MVSYGKQCARCRMYFVSPVADETTCSWCRQTVAGRMAPELLIEREPGPEPA